MANPEVQTEVPAAEPVIAAPAVAKAKVAKAKPVVELFPVKLLRHYRPQGMCEIVGYFKEALRVKNAAGQMVEAEAAGFIDGQGKPATYPGAGFEDKIWAGTTVRLELDEAKRAIALKIAERADALPA